METNIAFRFTTTPLTSLTYNDALLDSEQRKYEALKLPRPFKNKTSDKGILLNGRQFENTLYSNKEYEITISADELETDDIAFFEAFWTAPCKYIAYRNNLVWTPYIEVITDSGRLPLSFVDDIDFLYELTFKLIGVNPD